MRRMTLELQNIPVGTTVWYKLLTDKTLFLPHLIRPTDHLMLTDANRADGIRYSYMEFVFSELDSSEDFWVDVDLLITYSDSKTSGRNVCPRKDIEPKHVLKRDAILGEYLCSVDLPIYHAYKHGLKNHLMLRCTLDVPKEAGIIHNLLPL